MLLTGWSTPTASDAKRGVRPPRPWDTGVPLSQQVAGWATPRARDHKGNGVSKAREALGVSDSLDHQVATDFGTRQRGLSAATEKRGQLNPAFPRWLMGYPDAWDACAPLATPSSRKSRRIS